MLMFDTPKPLHVRVGERSNHMEMRLLDAIFLVVESPFLRTRAERPWILRRSYKREMVCTSTELEATEYFFEVMERVFVRVRRIVEESEGQDK